MFALLSMGALLLREICSELARSLIRWAWAREKVCMLQVASHTNNSDELWIQYEERKGADKLHVNGSLPFSATTSQAGRQAASFAC